MHSFSRSLLGLGALTLAGCGAPAELDESRFPGLNDTGYTDLPSPVGGGGVGSGGAPPSSAGAPGTSGTGNASIGGSGSGSGSVGQGGSSPTGGNGSVAAGGNPPVGQGGTASGGGSGGQTAGGSCPDDITVLFKRPASQGGCDGAGCHIPVGGTRPDLISPNVEDRLLGIASNCEARPYIGTGSDDSYLADKIAGEPGCGSFAMPFGSPQSLSAADEQCILDWIDEVSGG